MEFRQLEAYVNVFELKSFSKAAEEMFLSQPSISAYITSLEKELGTQLIYRSTKEFIPTKTGIMFYKQVKEMLSLRDQTVYSIKNSFSPNMGSIDVLASSVPSQYILPKLFGEFHKSHPDVIFRLEQADSDGVVKGICAYESEIGFAGAKTDNPKCIFTDFLSEKLVMIAPNEKRFKNINSDNALGLLKNEYFVMREAGSGTRLFYEKALRNMGLNYNSLKISAQLSNTQSILQSVASGLGISIVSELAAQDFLKQKLIVTIEGLSLPERKFYIVQKSNRSQTPVAASFIDFALSSVKG